MKLSTFTVPKGSAFNANRVSGNDVGRSSNASFSVWAKRFVWLLIMFVLAAAVALWAAPASWLDGIIRQASEGRLRMTDTQGGLWSGSGRLVLANIDSAEAGLSSHDSLISGVQIPGRCDWQLNPWPLFLAQLDIRLKLEHMKETVSIKGNRQKLLGSAGSFDLPQIRMDRLGSPWNTIQPSGALSVRWESFQVEQGKFVGKAAVTVAQAASALSNVRPLGSYRIDIDSNGQKAQIGITTLNGPLQLDGQGDWTLRGGLKFLAYAQATAEQLKLQPLLSLLGKRDGDRTIIRLGAV
jgi:general secretion pathway protein N